MISWDPDESWDKGQYYEAEHRAADRERLVGGWKPLEGWRRPVDPMCPAHNFGLVDGACGECLMERKAMEAAA